MKALTRYFGEMEYQDEAVVHFPSGLPAFDEETRFLLIERSSTAPLVFLQSLLHPELCFLTLPILAVDPAYRISINAADLRALDLDSTRQPLIGTEVLCLAVIAAGEQGSSANLLAPVIVNPATQRGLQAIRVDLEYSPQHPLEKTCS